ncbi:hypothetical protein INT44_002844 [Umbelopsis vinacea]|uniref:Uncharacterized protein n=1 Tax=Umbelopsis vinacea TaxID=44442 RepID=A0A8H7UKL2_9FUNG|nr:hypothetical protein INT44_002844 [Umbelopsis vinacea]KAI9290207.1 hypothetical protein BC943DRAFT_299534 [Umbelopsis sp. AD052]
MNTIYTICILIASCLLLSAQAANPVFFCKCYCGANSTVFPLPTEDPKPCLLCTKQMCIDSVTDGTCDGIKDSTCPSVDFKGLCFARDSYKDEAIVWSFLVLTFSLIAVASVKPRVEEWWKKRNNYASFSTTSY